MKSLRTTTLILAALAVVLLPGCTAGNHSADTVAPVFFTADITEGPADVDISLPIDVTIPTMTWKSQAKAPGAQLGPQADAVFSEWVVTATRSDGGTAASPQWRNFYNVVVPAGGTANLKNYRIFPAEYFKLAPLNQLLPENGGMDTETGKRNIRQRLRIEAFGKTIAGDKVQIAFDVDLNFFYLVP